MEEIRRKRKVKFFNFYRALSMYPSIHERACFLISQKTHTCRDRIIYGIDLRFDLCFFCFLCFTSDRKTCNNFAIVMHFIVETANSAICLINKKERKKKERKKERKIYICLDPLITYLSIFLLTRRGY